MSPMGFAVLSGAGLIKAGEDNAHLHIHQTTQAYADVTATEIVVDATSALTLGTDSAGKPVYETVCTGLDSAIYGLLLNATGDVVGRLKRGQFKCEDVVAAGKTSSYSATPYVDNAEEEVELPEETEGTGEKTLKFVFPNEVGLKAGDSVLVLVDYYVVKKSGAYQIDIEPEKFAGNYYLEASTLFRRQVDGVDLPAELVLPNIRIQSNFTFTMTSSGDPSTFSFVADAFPDFTKWNKSKKVLATLQIIDASGVEDIDGDFTRQTIDGSVEVATGTGHKDNQTCGSDIANA